MYLFEKILKLCHDFIFLIFFLFLGTILVDTVNTSPEAGKTTPYDREMLGRLMLLIPDLDTEKLYDDIQQAKNDVSGN